MKRKDVATGLLLSVLCTVMARAAGDPSKLIINEIQVANIDGFVDPSYNYGGWVEFYNPTDEPITLGKLFVSQDASNLKFFQLHLYAGTVPAHGFKNIWFDHNASDGYYGPNAHGQIPFKMDAEGGIIELRDGEGYLVDAVEYPAAVPRCSYMRLPDGENNWKYTSEPTVERSNHNATVGGERVQAPEADRKGGLFTGIAELNVTIPDHCTLYYTTDCSTPFPGRRARRARRPRPWRCRQPKRRPNPSRRRSPR